MKAVERRLRELERLPFRVVAVTRWHYRAGNLHIWPASGRWCNEATGERGLLRTTSISSLTIGEWNRELEELLLRVAGHMYPAAKH